MDSDFDFDFDFECDRQADWLGRQTDKRYFRAVREWARSDDTSDFPRRETYYEQVKDELDILMAALGDLADVDDRDFWPPLRGRRR